MSAGRLPLWAGLLGAAAIVGAYEETYTNAPSQFLAEAPTAATTVLFAVALGYLATSLVAEGLHASATAGTGGKHARDESEGLDDLFAGESK